MCGKPRHSGIGDVQRVNRRCPLPSCVSDTLVGDGVCELDACLRVRWPFALESKDPTGIVLI